MSAQYIVFASQFAVSVIISRFFLTPAEVGLFSIALSAAMLVSLLQDFGITRYIAGEPNLNDAQIRTCFSVSAVFAVGIGLLIFALAWPVADFYREPHLLPLLVVVSLSYLMVPFGIVPSALLLRKLDFRSLFFVNVGAALANAAVALSLAAAGWSAMSLAWAAVAQQAVRAILAQWRSGCRLRFPLSLSGSRPIIRFGSGLSALYVTSSIGTRSPELIIGKLLDFTAVGLFGRASSLTAQLCTLASGAVEAVFYPAFARLRDNNDDLAAPYLRVVAGYTGVVWPAMTFLAVASAPLVLMLYGPVWAGVAPLLVWAACSELFFSALPLHAEIPILLGRMRRLFWLNIIETFTSVALLVLGAFWSIEWAMASRVGYGLVWFAVYAPFLRRLVGFNWAPMLAIYSKSIAVSLAAALPLLLVYGRLAKASDLHFLALLGAAAAGGLSWLVMLFLVRHPIRHELVGMLQTLGEAVLRPASYRQT